MKIEMWSIDQVKPYENNPRLNDDAVASVAASIREFGFQQPLVVDSVGVIIVGHTRLKAAQKLGLDRVPVLVATNLTPEQVRAYRIADIDENLEMIDNAWLICQIMEKDLKVYADVGILLVRAYMTPHEIDPRFATEIARMKKLAIEKYSLDRRGLLATVVAGLVAGVAAWFGLIEPDRPFGERMGISAGVGALVSTIAFVIYRVSTDTPANNNCPRCSYCWGVAEYEYQWLEWKCCPSCGLKINDDA